MVSLLTGSDDQDGVRTNEDGGWKQVDVKGIENALKKKHTQPHAMVVCIVGRREKKKRIMTEPFKMDLLLQHSSVWCV